jgi:putative NADH-flavin reductase
MKLTIIAATGGVGRQLLRQAPDAGHDVTAVARNPANLPASAPASRASFPHVWA